MITCNQNINKHVVALNDSYFFCVFSGTPDTYLPDLPTKPDISMQCRRCGLYIQLPDLRDHRYYHSALSLLKYFGSNRPSTVDALFRRRNTIMKKLKSAVTHKKTLDQQQIQHIDEAYEYLKADLDGSLEEFRSIQTEIDTKVRGVAVNSSCPCVLAVGFCSTSNGRWKSYMEDARVYQDEFGGDSNKTFFGLYDGHHGPFASEMCASNLHSLLRLELSKFDPNTTFLNPDDLPKITTGNDFSQMKHIISEKTVNKFDSDDEESLDIIKQIVKICEDKYNPLSRENTKSSKKRLCNGDSVDEKAKMKSPMSEKMEAAFRKTYHLMDILLSYGKNECSRARWSGCSALTAVVHSDPCEEEITQPEVVVSPDPKEVIENEPNPEAHHGHNSHSPPRQLGFLYLANAGERAMSLLKILWIVSRLHIIV